MEFALTPEQKLIQQTAREFADEKLAPLAAEYDRKEEFTAPQAKMLAEMGFLGMMVAEEYGGSGLDTIIRAGDGGGQPRLRVDHRNHDRAELAGQLAR